MKQAVGFIALTLVLSATGCNGNPTAKVLPGGNGGNPTKAKVLPALTPQNRRMAAMEELARLHRSALFLSTRPGNNGPDGCINYRSAAPTSAIFLRADYGRCAWTRPAADQPTVLVQYHLRGRETFSQPFSAGDLVASAKLRMTLTRITTPSTPAGDFDYTREVRLAVPSGSVPSNYVYPFSATVTWGDAYNPASEYWNADYQKGFWHKDTGGWLESDFVIEFTHRAPTAGSKPAASSKLKITAESEVKFEGVCQRPVGTFSWELKEGSQSAEGQFRTDADGLVDTKTNERTPWPKPCLEENRI